MKRKDKFHFAKLSRKYKDELRDFFVANLVDKDYWVGDLLENEAHKRYTEWKKRQQKLSYQFKQDVNHLLKKERYQRSNLTTEWSMYPHLLKEYMGKRISVETLVMILDHQCH